MAVIVQKYGGSSVATPDKIQLVAQRIAQAKQRGDDVVVVVSAMGSTTDELLARAHKVSRTPSRRELDMLLSCGERASMALLSMAVADLGYEAISFTGSQAGVMTNDRHAGARIIEVRPVRVQDELARGKVVIVAGFQGVSYKREITTLGRGGSDATAVALAAALGAAYCEICSDVDGVYTADPRVVNAATLIKSIAHDEMLTAASVGAKVLNADAVAFAKHSGIALYARATNQSGGGTRVDAPNENATAPFIVSTLAPIVRVQCPLQQLTAALPKLHEAGVSILHAQMMHPRATLYANLQDAPEPSHHETLLRAINGADVQPNLAAVSVTQLAIGSAPAFAHTLLQVAGAMALLTAPLCATVICAASDQVAVARALHAHMTATSAIQG